MLKNKVVWTPLAGHSLHKTAEFLLNSWGQPVADQFLDLVDSRIAQLLQVPESAPKIEGTRYRRLNVHKHVSMFYMVQEHLIVILLFWDNRKAPEQLFQKLRQSLDF